MSPKALRCKHNKATRPTRRVSTYGFLCNYADHLDDVLLFLNELDSNDAKSIRKAKAIIAKTNIKRDLAFIKCHFARIPAAIKTLEEKGTPLTNAIKTFMSVRIDLLGIQKREEFLEKFDFVHNKNNGLKTLEVIGEILTGDVPKDTEREKQMNEMNPNELAAFKYAPITSCDVERSFSAYKRLLEDCRHSFLFENLKKHVVIHCNKFD